MITREHYIEKVRPFYDSDLIKIITGIRRCGKSVILEQIMDEIGRTSDNIIYLNFEDKRVSANITNAEKLLSYVEERKKDGKCYPGGILKVDKFINHQMDPNLMKDIAVEFIRRFASSNVNKILTIEASGIAPAIMMGFLLNLPVVFAKKKKPNTMENMLSTTVSSFTKQRQYNVIISRDYLTPNDKVLFIDDFLAYGNAAKGIIELIEQSGAELVGMGFIIEKAFQDGGRYLRNKGIHVESLAIIESLDNCEIKLREE